MLVDDEPEFIDLLKFLLEREGSFAVDSAQDVRSALERLEGEDYDAVISDYQMPEMDGLDFLKIVKARGEDIPFILLTGKGREDVAVEALNLGADFYVQKHGDSKSMHAELANAVRQAVAKRNALESLKTSEKTYRQLIELAQDGIWVIDDVGVTQLVNPRMADMLGYSRDEMLGRTFFEFMDKEQLELAEEYFKRRMNGVSEHHEFSFVRKDGSVLHALLGASPVTDVDGDVVGGIAVVTDISNRVETEEAIRRERDAAKRYLDIARVIILAIDSGGKVTLINKRGCEILGYPEEEVVGEDWFERFIPERNRAEIRAIFSKVVSKEMPFKETFVNTVVTKSGEERLIRWHNVALTNEAGEVAQTLSSGEDITEANLAERRLQRTLDESEAVARLSTMLISPTMSVSEVSRIVLKFALSLTDSEHGFVSSIDPVTKSVISHTITGMMDVGSSSAGAKDAGVEFQIGEDGRYPSLWGVALNTRKPYFTNSPSESDASTGVPRGHVPLQNFLSVPVIYGDELVGLIAVSNSSRNYDKDDIDIVVRLAGVYAVALQREKDIAALVMIQSRFRSFMDHSSAVTYMKDVDGRYVFANEEYERLLGLDEEQILGKTDGDLWPVSTARQFRDNDRKVLSSREAGKFIEVVPKEGSVHEYLSFKFPIADSKGEFSLLGGVSADITDLRKFETALDLANRKLRILGNLTRHDSINQLSVIRGWLELAEKEIGEADASGYLGKISKTLDVLERQLEFAGEYEHIGVDEHQWIDLKSVCDREWSEFGTKDIRLECLCEGVEVHVDPMFSKVVRNLIDNTLRHGGKIGRVELVCEERPDGLLLVYTDDGVGIPPAAKEEIFERGYGSNTGLGLYMVRELLSIGGISIRETGEPGAGARFEMLFPEGKYRRSRATDEG